MAKRDNAVCATNVVTKKLTFFIVVMNFVGGMVRLEVVVKTGGREGVTKGVDNKDKGNQHGEDFVRETGSVLDELVNVHETTDQAIDHNPKTDPRVEG